jgi:chromate transporter
MVKTEVVDQYGWLTSREFVDAVTLGQATPGPVVISATFIGYRVYGIAGAIMATVSVILPSFILVCLATQCIEKFRNNEILLGFFRGARIAVIALIFEAVLNIGGTSILDFKTASIALISLVIFMYYRLNPMWVLLAAVAIGLII